MHIKIRKLLTITFLFLYISYNSINAFASEIKPTADKGIFITPSGALIFNENMAPGDTVSAEFKVKAIYESQLTVYIDATKESGDDILFKKLELSVESQDAVHTYYKGPIGEIDNALLDILKDEEKIYKISVLFPTDAGNEYQGTTVTISLIFTAEALSETIQQTISATNDSSPPTGDESMPINILLTFLSLLIMAVIATKKVYANK